MNLQNKHKSPLLILFIIMSIPACIPMKIKKAAQPRAAFLFESDSPQDQAASSSETHWPIATQIDTHTALYEAKLDIPFLFGTQCTVEQDEEDQKIINYETNTDHEAIIQFYRDEMERLGWQYFSGMQSSESLLVFRKPFKMALVSVRPALRNAKHTIVIHIMHHQKIED